MTESELKIYENLLRGLRAEFLPPTFTNFMESLTSMGLFLFSLDSLFGGNANIFRRRCSMNH